MLDDSGDGSSDRNISALHETSGNKGNSLQDSASNSSLEKDIIATLGKESDSIKKGLVGDVMDSEADDLGVGCLMAQQIQMFVVKAKTL